jgi:5-formyltetrahydrofolate cyclo-ligase
VSAAKAELRRRYRTLRRGIEDPLERSERICAALTEHRAVVTAGTVMVFDAIVGEPDLGNLRHWCEQRGIAVVVPEQDPDPGSVDVIIVPGVAFTPHGDRLGQGGGWYDRFLERVSDDVVTIGVAFAEQIVDAVPLEAHDRRLDAVLCDDGWVLTVS